MGTFAYVVKADQTVSIKPLKLGPIEGEKVAVLEGLQADELVVVDGADKLRENMLIKLITPEATAAVDQEPLLPDKKTIATKIEKAVMTSDYSSR